MEAKEVGLKLIDIQDAYSNNLNRKINLYRKLGYYVDISTTFEEVEDIFDGKNVHEVYTLLIYKEQPNE